MNGDVMRRARHRSGAIGLFLFSITVIAVGVTGVFVPVPGELWVLPFAMGVWGAS